MIPCTQIYSALCDYDALAASLSLHPGHYDSAGLAGEIQNALIWGEYSHGHYGAEASAAIEDHVASVIANSEAMLLHAYKPASVDPHFVSAVTASIEALCSVATPAMVGAAALNRSGCQRTAELIEDIASAHANKGPGGALYGSLPSNEHASQLFAMSALALTEGAIMSPAVTYVRRGTDAFFVSNDKFACHDSVWNFVSLFGGEVVTLPAG